MYDSLKELMNLPIVIRPFVKRSGTGTKEYGASVDILGYAEGNMVRVTNTKGVEVISSTQLYIDGAITIKSEDAIVFDGKESSIANINTFYRDANADIRVVYL